MVILADTPSLFNLFVLLNFRTPFQTQTQNARDKISYLSDLPEQSLLINSIFSCLKQ